MLQNLVNMIETITDNKLEKDDIMLDGSPFVNRMEFKNSNPLLLVTNENKFKLVLPYEFYTFEPIERLELNIGFYDKNGVTPYNYYYEPFSISERNYNDMRQAIFRYTSHINELDHAFKQLSQDKKSHFNFQKNHYYKCNNKLINLFDSVAAKLLKEGTKIERYYVKSRFLEDHAFVLIPSGGPRDVYSLNLHSNLANKLLESTTQDVFDELKQKEIISLPSPTYAY